MLWVGEDVNKHIQVDKGTAISDHDYVFDLLEGLPKEVCELGLLFFLVSPAYFKVFIIFATHPISINAQRDKSLATPRAQAEMIMHNVER